MANTALVINEFDEVGLDNVLVQHSNGNDVESENGRICYILRGNLQKTLLDLASKRLAGDISSFNRLVIETTGFAIPAPIPHTLTNSLDLEKYFLLDGFLQLLTR